MLRKYTLSGFALTALVSIASSPAKAQSVFADVPDNHWAAAAVKRLAQAGIIGGYPNPGELPQNNVQVKRDVAKDAEVAGRVKVALLTKFAPLSPHISVDANRGVVILTGKVTNTAQRKLVEDITRRNAMGYKVVNELKISNSRSR